MSTYSVSIVVPVYKNEGSIGNLLERISEISSAVSGNVEAIFVVDGSPDKSLDSLRTKLPVDGFDAKVLLLSRNFGSFSAIRAGLREAQGEATVMMAAYLQEPTSLIVDMLGTVQQDKADVAVGVRQ